MAPSLSPILSKTEIHTQSVYALAKNAKELKGEIKKVYRSLNVHEGKLKRMLKER